MLYDVYRMRCLGEELATETIARTGPVRGTVEIVPTGFKRAPRGLAVVIDAKRRDLLPPLDYVQQESCAGRPDVLVLTGWEDLNQNPKSSRPMTYQQCWVCVEVTPAGGRKS